MVGTFVTVAAAFFAAMAVMVLGTPIATRFARPQRWRKTLGPAQSDRDAQVTTGPSFEPLDLGPDPMRWPSETPWVFAGREELPWPSQTWDDPHFGKRARVVSTGTDADYEAAKASRREAARSQREAEADKRARAPQVRRDNAQRKEDASQRAKQEMRSIRDRAAELQGQVRERIGEEVRAAAQREARYQTGRVVEAVEEHLAPLGVELDSVEIEEMVANLGLAGTVQEIMKRTQWDFKTAAQYLAKSRRGR